MMPSPERGRRRAPFRSWATVWSWTTRGYRTLALGLAATACALSSTVALLTLGWPTTLVVLVGSAAAGAALYWLALSSDPARPGGALDVPMLRVSWSSALVVLSLVGAGGVGGAAGVAVLVGLLLLVPDTVALLRRWVRPSSGDPVRHADRPAVTRMSPEQLCLAWQRSFEAVRRERDPDRLGQLLATRYDYLDELERRDPEGFRVWIDRYARPDGDPGPHLSLDRFRQ